MGQYTITLNPNQEDALAALVEEQTGNRTAAQMVQDLVVQHLVAKEQAIEAALQRLDEAGAALPEVMRERLTADFTPAQRARLPFLSTHRGGSNAPGRGPRIR